MDVVTSVKPLYAILISLVTVVLVLAFPKKPAFRDNCTVVSAIVTFAIILSMLPWIRQGGMLEYDLVRFFPGLRLHCGWMPWVWYLL